MITITTTHRSFQWSNICVHVHIFFSSKLFLPYCIHQVHTLKQVTIVFIIKCIHGEFFFQQKRLSCKIFRNIKVHLQFKQKLNTEKKIREEKSKQLAKKRPLEKSLSVWYLWGDFNSQMKKGLIQHRTTDVSITLPYSLYIVDISIVMLYVSVFLSFFLAQLELAIVSLIDTKQTLKIQVTFEKTKYWMNGCYV